MNKSKRIVIALALLVMVVWGSLFPMIKLGYQEFSIDTSFAPNLILFAGIRFTICGIILTCFNFIKFKSVKLIKTKKDFLWIFLVGVTAVAIHYACTYIGLSKMDSSKSAILKQSGVILFVVFSSLIIKDDKFSIGKIIGAVLGLGSIIVLNFDSLKFSFGLGETLVIIASFCTVVSNVFCKLFLKKTNATIITSISQLLGGLILLIVGLACGGRIGGYTLKGIFIFVYIILATIVSYYIWYAIVQKYDLSKLFIIKLIEPLFAAIIGALILKEQIWKWQYLVSFVLIGIAMFVCNFNLRKNKENIEKTQQNCES